VVELGHQLAVRGGAGCEFVAAFFELQAQVGGLLFEVGVFWWSALMSAGEPSPDSRHACSPSNTVLAAVRGMIVHAVAEGSAPGHLVEVLYEVADDRDLPAAAHGEDGGAGWRMRARHRLHEPDTRVDRPDDGDAVAVLQACGSARDRLIVLLMVRAGLRRGEVLGLRRDDIRPAR
jgi:integrase/recombinase XerD